MVLIGSSIVIKLVLVILSNLFVQYFNQEPAKGPIRSSSPTV